MFIDPTKLAETTKEDLVSARVQVMNAFEELKGELEAIDQQLIESLPMNEQIIGDYVVKKTTRTTFDITLDKAREYGAVKVVPEKITPATEAIDTPALHKLVKQGVELPTKTTTRIEVIAAEQDNEQ